MITIDLTGKRFLIVGASSGIGRAVAVRATRAGGSTVLVGRRASHLDEVVAEGGGGTAIVADVTDPGDCDRIVDESLAVLGGFDAIVHAVGAEFPKVLADVDAQNWSDTFAINVTGPALITSRALPSVATDGLVAFMSSSSVGDPYYGLTPYGAAKAALDEVVMGYRVEHPEHRFTRLGVGPTMGTDMARGFDAATESYFSKWLAAGMLNEQYMQADDLGALITELIALLLAHPGVVIPDVSFLPPGGIETAAGAADEIADLVEVVAENANRE